MIGFKRKVSIHDLELDLISIHIPKTAGTSFREQLVQNYGKNAITQFDIIYEEGIIKYKINGEYVEKPLFNPETKVIHGHFEYFRLIEFCPKLVKTPTITWLRDPAQRVISNYNYLKEKLFQEISTNALASSLASRMLCTLAQFSALENERNKMSKFLKGISAEGLFFIGLVENYEKDLTALAVKLKWNNYTPVYNNITKKVKKEISPLILQEICNNNSEDVLLYSTTMKLINA